MLTLRPARERDVPALIELARRSWQSGFAATAPAVFVQDWLARDFERTWYPRCWPDMTVAEAEGVMLGVVQPLQDEINGLWVEPAAQGQGVGTALLRHGEGVIAAAGYPRAWLSCSGYNMKAQHFYRARGYREVCRITKERSGGVVEAMLTFERQLSFPGQG